MSPKKVNFIPKKDGEKLPSFYSNLETSNEAQGIADEKSDSGSTDNDEDYEDFLDSDKGVIVMMTCLRILLMEMWMIRRLPKGERRLKVAD
jgi:hypothetical protein